MVEKNDNYLREAYDHEQSIKEAAKEEGFEEGKRQGLEQGIEQDRKEIVMNMYESGMKEEEISKVTHILLEKIKEILEK